MESGGALEGGKGYMCGGSHRAKGRGCDRIMEVEDEEKEEEDYGCSSAQLPASPGGPAGPIGPSLALY